LLALKQSEPESREVYWAWHGLGDIKRSRGRLDPILASYRAAQSSADRLAKADRGNADWQCVSKKNGQTATALDLPQLGRAIMMGSDHAVSGPTLCGDETFAWFDGQIVQLTR
jgi:hypothetical protein